MISEAAKQARRAYKNKWNAEHKDRVKEYQARYWEKKAAQAAADQSQEAQGAEDLNKQN